MGWQSINLNLMESVARSPGKEPVPTNITEKRKRVLEAEKLRPWNKVYSVAFFATNTTHS